MAEAQHGRVQRLPSQPVQRSGSFWWKRLRFGCKSRAINAVSRDWRADMGHMHPHLMRAPRFKAAPDDA